MGRSKSPLGAYIQCNTVSIRCKCNIYTTSAPQWYISHVYLLTVLYYIHVHACILTTIRMLRMLHAHLGFDYESLHRSTGWLHSSVPRSFHSVRKYQVMNTDTTTLVNLQQPSTVLQPRSVEMLGGDDQNGQEYTDVLPIYTHPSQASCQVTRLKNDLHCSATTTSMAAILYTCKVYRSTGHLLEVTLPSSYSSYSLIHSLHSSISYYWNAASNTIKCWSACLGSRLPLSNNVVDGHSSLG